jgi:hypothetical protein
LQLWVALHVLAPLVLFVLHLRTVQAQVDLCIWALVQLLGHRRAQLRFSQDPAPAQPERSWLQLVPVTVDQRTPWHLKAPVGVAQASAVALVLHQVVALCPALDAQQMVLVEW